MGEIGDGEVRDLNENGYLFESEPKGNLYGNEQDFHLYFGKDKMHIVWGDSCDYVLDRGDGSAESVEDWIAVAFCGPPGILFWLPLPFWAPQARPSHWR